MLTERNREITEGGLVVRTSTVNQPRQNDVGEPSNEHPIEIENDIGQVFLPPDVEYGSLLDVGDPDRLSQILGGLVVDVGREVAIITGQEEQVFGGVAGGEEDRINAVDGDMIDGSIDFADFRNDEEMQNVWCIEHCEYRQEAEGWRSLMQTAHNWREWEGGNTDRSMQMNEGVHDDNNDDWVMDN